MNLVHSNPFRILGLPVTASEREIAKRISDLAIHAEMGTTPTFINDFPVLSDVHRDSQAIKDASNHIEQPENKLFYSQFWFWNQNEADEQACEHLRNDALPKAVTVWTKTFEGGKVTKKNYSNMRNLSVLLLALAGKNYGFNKDYLTKGIILAGKTFNTTYFFNYAESVVHNTLPIDKDHIMKAWIEELLQSFKAHIDTSTGISTKEMLECFKYFPLEIRQYVADKFVFKPFQSIEDEIHSAGERRTVNPERSKFFGVELYNNVKADIQYLKLILTDESIKYQSISDKLANEILQCSIDYFNQSIENKTETKAAEDAQKLAEMAKSVAVGGRVKARIDENIELIQKWESEQTNKEKVVEVQEQVDLILDHIRDLPFIKGLSYYERIRLPGIAEKFLENCHKELQVIRSVLGKDDSYYVQLCTVVANNALGMCVLYVNTTDDPRAVSTIMEQVDQLDMDPKLRQRFEANRNKLERIMMRRGLLQ